MAEEVKVFGIYGSPYSRRVEIALRLKGVDYQYFEEDLYNKSPLLLKYNPIHKKVPVLLHNGNPIAESVVILEYVDDVWKQYPLLPSDPYDRAVARFWTKFIDDKCMPALWKAWHAKEGKERAVEDAGEALKPLERALEGKRFFGGDTIGMVDIAAAFIGYWLIGIQEVVPGLELVTPEKTPLLFKWSQEFVSTVKESLPEEEKLLAFLKSGFVATYYANK